MDRPANRREPNRKRSGEVVSILYVDDDPIARRIMERQLRSEGYQLVCLDNGPEALYLLVNTNFDEILPDVMMPGMSGVEVLQWLRETNPDLPVIMLTGSIDSDLLDQIEPLGCVAILEKPCGAEEIRTQLQTAAGLFLEKKNA